VVSVALKLCELTGRELTEAAVRSELASRGRNHPVSGGFHVLMADAALRAGRAEMARTAVRLRIVGGTSCHSRLPPRGLSHRVKRADTAQCAGREVGALDPARSGRPRWTGWQEALLAGSTPNFTHLADTRTGELTISHYVLSL
jgi:hypothetical protein